MALPLIPLAFKGAVVAFKLLKAKGAITTVAKATTISAKTIGVKATVTTIGAALVGAGALQWTYERFLKAQSVVNLVQSGNPAKAASELAGLVASFGSVGGNDFLSKAQDWKDAGMSFTTAQFLDLTQELKGLVDEMVESGSAPITT